MDLHCSFVSQRFLFYSSLLNFKLPQGQQCVSAALLLQQQHLAKWAGTMLLDTVNSTCLSPPVDDWCVVLYTLLRLSLTHTPTNVTAYAAQVRSLSFTCSLFLSLFLPSFSCWLHALTDKGYIHMFTYHLHYNLDKLCRERGPAILPKELLWVLQHKSIWRFVIVCDGAIKDRTVKLFSWEIQREQLLTQC